MNKLVADRRSVVVTGLGAITPLGVTFPETWEGLLAGKSGLSRLTRFPEVELPFSVVGELPELDLRERLSNTPELRRMERVVAVGMAAAAEAMSQSGLDAVDTSKLDGGVIFGTGIGMQESAVMLYGQMKTRGWSRIHPLSVPKLMYNAISSHISMHFGLRGSNHVVVTACASGSMAIAQGAMQIAHGYHDMMVVGGADLPLFDSQMAAWTNLRVMSKVQDPFYACSPFDVSRDGLVLSEGAAALILEEESHARARGATILARLEGFGQSSDAAHLTAPNSEGQALALRQALRLADVEPNAIGYINAHGTGTKSNDATELDSLKTVMGEALTSIPISSTKSMLGHAMGASGAIEACISVQSLLDRKIPPTNNLRNPDEAAEGLDLPTESRETPDLARVMSNSFGFGGHNSVLIFESVQD